MLNTVEETARKMEAYSITARIQPFGEFADRTFEFYKKNGFEIVHYYEDRKVYGNKKLPELEDEYEIEM